MAPITIDDLRKLEREVEAYLACVDAFRSEGLVPRPVDEDLERVLALAA